MEIAFRMLHIRRSKANVNTFVDQSVINCPENENDHIGNIYKCQYDYVPE